MAIVARNKGDLEATARELATETNRRIVPLAADVTSKEQVDRMVAEAAQQLGGLHILVNSGSAPGGSATATGPIETVIDEDLLQDFNVACVHTRKSRYFSLLEDTARLLVGTLGGTRGPRR